MPSWELLQRMQAQRNRAIRMEGSPYYPHTFGEIAAGANEFVGLFDAYPATQKYLPFKTALFTNGSTEAVDLEINGRAFTRVRPGVVLSLTDVNINTFRVTNNDSGTATAGLITLLLHNPPIDADMVARERYG